MNYILYSFFNEKFCYRDCKVSARNVVLREFDNDGFVIVTDIRSKKIDNLVSLYEILTFDFFIY